MKKWHLHIKYIVYNYLRFLALYVLSFSCRNSFRILTHLTLPCSKLRHLTGLKV
jgi:hypothetical protein